MHEPELPDVAALTSHPRISQIKDVPVATLQRDAYKPLVKELQLKMVQMQRKVGDYGLRVVLVFEGMDAAGKGGAIKRLMQFLDPRGYRVHSLETPTAIDEAHHYLRRFWVRLPKRGRITVFDDYSWYSRLLVERAEKLVTPEQIARAPRQIREFERSIVEEGYILLKFWIQVSRDEQYKRFKKRLNNPYKSWKMTPEDWRNREMYKHYIEYAQEVISVSNEPYAPWFLIPGDDKLHSRISVLQVVTDVIEAWPVKGTPMSPRFARLDWLAEHAEDPDD